jgi:hypothetical protein
VTKEDSLALAVMELIAAHRGGIPADCDFCGQPFTDKRYPTPEECGEWACIECVNRWETEA